MMKRIVRFLTFALLATLCLGLTGCADKKSSEAAKTDAVEAFLTEFFSFNHQQRYDILSASVRPDGPDTAAESVESLSEKQRQAYEEYYRPFKAMATQDCIETMQASRLPLKYEKLFAEKGISAQIDQIYCEAYNENTYTFEVSFILEEGAEWLQPPIKGRVTIQTADGGIYVDSITIN